jgi:hypothetical protein
MANFFEQFNLFIPGKAAKEINQPGYGTDMRTIENWAKVLFGYIEEVFNQFIGGFHQVPFYTFGAVMVGTTPPTTDQLKASMFIESVTVTAGAAAVALTGFSVGYNAQLTPADNVGLTYTLNPSGSSLTSLAMFVYDDTGAPYTGTDAVSVLVIGA